MGNYSSVMRTMRKYVSDARSNHGKMQEKLQGLEQFKNSVYYTEKAAEVKKTAQDALTYLRRQAQDELTDTFAQMRANVKKRVTKAPTQDIAASLSILGQLDEITVPQMSMYAEIMSDYPLAMQLLRQIGTKHNIKVSVPDVEAMTRSVDVLEDNVYAILAEYDGSDKQMRMSLERLKGYFQPEENFLDMPGVQTAEKADAAFWNNIIQCGSPTMLDDPNMSGTPVKVDHFFNSLDGLLKYIDVHTQGLNVQERDEKINEILESCPDNYGAIYRNYRATGDKLPLNQSIDETFERFVAGDTVYEK